MASTVKKYSQSLMSVLKEDELDRVKLEFDDIVEGVNKTDGFYELMSNPKIGTEQKHEIIRYAFGDITKPLLNTIMLLSDRNKFEDLPEIHKAFVAEYNQHKDQDDMIVESAYELSNEELKKIGEKFLDVTGLSKLIIENKVNEDLIGGFRVFIGTKVYDSSIQSQLNQLKQQFKVRTNS